MDYFLRLKALENLSIKDSSWLQLYSTYQKHLTPSHMTYLWSLIFTATHYTWWKVILLRDTKKLLSQIAALTGSNFHRVLLREFFLGLFSSTLMIWKMLMTINEKESSIQMIRWSFFRHEKPYKTKSAVENIVQKLVTYFETHILTINAEKNRVKTFSQPSKNETVEHLKLQVRDQIIESSSCVKYLGVCLDRKLSFQNEMKNILRKMATGIKVLYDLQNIFPEKIRSLLLNALVIRYLQYSAILLGSIRKISKLLLKNNWIGESKLVSIEPNMKDHLIWRNAMISCQYAFYWIWKPQLISIDGKKDLFLLLQVNSNHPMPRWWNSKEQTCYTSGSIRTQDSWRNVFSKERSKCGTPNVPKKLKIENIHFVQWRRKWRQPLWNVSKAHWTKLTMEKNNGLIIALSS